MRLLSNPVRTYHLLYATVLFPMAFLSYAYLAFLGLGPALVDRLLVPIEVVGDSGIGGDRTVRLRGRRQGSTRDARRNYVSYAWATAIRKLEIVLMNATVPIATTPIWNRSPLSRRAVRNRNTPVTKTISTSVRPNRPVSIDRSLDTVHDLAKNPVVLLAGTCVAERVDGLTDPHSRGEVYQCDHTDKPESALQEQP